MKYLSTVLAAVALLAGVEAACTADLPIDEYTNYNTSGRNAVGGYSSDDDSCSKLSGGSKSLSITPGQATCYYYTNFPSCYNADGEGYSGITFTVNGPANSKFNVVAKTLQGCSASAAPESSFYNVALTGGSQTITIPFSSWTGDFTNVQSFIFEDFSDSASTFTLGAINFKCGGTKPSSTSSIKTTLSTVTSKPPSSPPAPPTTSSKSPSSPPAPPTTTSKPVPPTTTSKPTTPSTTPSTTPKPVTTSSDTGVIITRSGRPTPSEVSTRGGSPIISIVIPILPPIVIGG